MKSKLVDGRDFIDGSKIAQQKKDFQQCWATYTLITEEANKLKLAIDNEMPLEEVNIVIERLVASGPKFKAWSEWQAAKESVKEYQLNVLTEALEARTLLPDEAEEQVLTAFCRWLAPRLIDGNEELLRFKASSHEQLISEFRKLDADVARTTSDYVAAIAGQAIPDPFAKGSPKEFGVLARELQKKTRHKPVRSLFNEMGSRLLDLCPCMMMSPLSVAQFLPSDFSGFDLVVFDEASQMTTWDSVGAIARGKNVIVVGDPKQMPPTSFFSGAVDIDDPDEDDLESILDQALAARLPHLRLKGHYRSRHESLIAFSNSKYYENSLITYPSSDTKESAVTMHRINGVYSKGKGRNNPIEATAVVKEIVKRLLDPERCRQSLGVVTLNTEQQRTIEDLLDDARRNNPEIEGYFKSSDTYDGVFVKNLESVQGDERDTIILSLGYGPTEPGGRTMSMNFGPLNKSGGERRLNVAITRATSEVLLFSSFDSSMIDLSRTSALAVEHLKHYIEFAERGPVALAEQATANYGVDQFDSDFEQAVAWALRAKGWKVQTQIGVSKFRVDLGVTHPDHPGVYLAGIECDGATYHGSPSARDRDRVRHVILENLGWRLIRLWSTDYFQDPSQAIETIDFRLQEILGEDRNKAALKEKEEAIVIDTPQVSNFERVSDTSGSDLIIDNAVVDTDTNISVHSEYDNSRYFDFDYRPTLVDTARSILGEKHCITLHELTLEIANLHGLSRTSKKQRNYIIDLL
ncbi:AAA domain-containing protein, partial [Porticoccaceae bacterium]|nr:AAA domain-containing protein [Porticoccaceae bacterium]